MLNKCLFYSSITGVSPIAAAFSWIAIIVYTSCQFAENQVFFDSTYVPSQSEYVQLEYIPLGLFTRLERHFPLSKWYFLWWEIPLMAYFWV